MSVHPEPRLSGRRGSVRCALLVVPDALLRELLCDTLRGSGCFPLPAASVQEGRRIASQVVPDVLIVDGECARFDDLLAAPEDGSDQRLADVPLLVLGASPTAKPPSPGDRLQICLDKPVTPAEVLARLRQLASASRRDPARMPAAPRSPLVWRDLEVDRDAPTLRRRVDGRWQAMDLSPREHRMLLALLQSYPRVMSREALRVAVWQDDPVTLRSVDQYVKRLRAALAGCGLRDLVGTCRGAGYRIEMGLLDGSG